MEQAELHSAIDILLVDDDDAFRSSTAAVLATLGYSCVEAPDIDRAWRLLECKRPRVVISDIRMRGNGRLAFVKRLAESEYRPTVILVTGHPSIDTAVQALDLQLVGYLIKPFEVDELRCSVERALRLRAERASLDRILESLVEFRAELDGLRSPRPDEGLPASDASPPVREPQGSLDQAVKEQLGWLTPRETEVVSRLAEGYRVSTIAGQLGISQHTVRRHLKSIFLKLDVRSQAELLEKLKPWRR